MDTQKPDRWWRRLASALGFSTDDKASAPRTEAFSPFSTTALNKAAKDTKAALGKTPAAPLDIIALWDFSNPALSEQRFLSAMVGASANDTLLLQTQVARTHGLRKNFSLASQLLAALEPQLSSAPAEVRVRHALESGRNLASAAHPAHSLGPEAKTHARQHFQNALDQARAAQLDGLTIDAIHMFAFVDTDPAQQLAWAQQALEVVTRSKQVAAHRWEPTVRNNLGYTLQQLGRHEDAFSQFSQALALRERGGNAAAAHSARFMLARSLRLLGRTSEALAWQQRLHQDALALGQADVIVLDELVLLHQARDETALTMHWSALAQQAPAKTAPLR